MSYFVPQLSYDVDTPSIEILELNDKEIKFTLDNCDLSFANALRRVMIAEVATMAIDTVLMFENKSVLFDEFLAHRLGMIPLRSDTVHQYTYVRECDCEDHCPNCSFGFKLSVKAQDDNQAVTSKDLQPLSSTPRGDDIRPVSPRDTDLTESQYSDYQAPSSSDPILIARLVPDQSISLQCYATKGIGKLHSKWSPVSSVKLQHEPDITINTAKMEELTDVEKQGFVKSCPTGVYSYDGRRVEVKDMMKCTFCNECIYYADEEIKKKQLVIIKEKPNKFTFTVEATGALPPERIVLDALLVLQKKLGEVEHPIETASSRGPRFD